MKGFLKSKITMGVLIGLLVLVSTLLTIFCVRPTAIGYTYKGEITVRTNVVLNYTYHFNSSTKLTQIMETETIKTEKEYWYFEHDGYIVKVGLYEDYTKEEYKERKQEIIDNWDENSPKLYNTKINAFFIEEGQEILLSVGSIVTVSILGVADLVLLILSIISIVKVCKNKTKKQEDKNVNKEEQKA